MKKLKVGLTGLGRIGKTHLDNLVNRLPEADLVAVSDILAGTKEVASQFGIANFYNSFQELVAHPGLEAVVICSPTLTHKECIEMAAEAGKHIFCEKPLEMTVGKIKEIRQTVQHYGVKLQVGFNRRFDADFARTRAMVAAGEIGEPHVLRITGRDPGPPSMEYIKGSGGLFLDMTIHDFDMARFIVNSEVIEVYAQGAVLVDKAIGQAGDIDTAIIQLRFENGVIGAIDNSRKAVYGMDQRLEIFGSKGMSQAGNHHLDSQVLFTETGSRKPPLLHFFIERYTESYA